MINKLIAGFLCLGVPVVVLSMDYTAELNERYAPHANWAERIDIERLEPVPASATWWRSPQAIRAGRVDSDPPLSGVHIALEPGHIGGAWAEIEGRSFRINPEDYYVREGDLVLEVGQRVKKELLELGAEVTLLRQQNAPLNPKRPEAYFLEAAERVPPPETFSWAAFREYEAALRRVMNRMAFVPGELIERARLVNEEVRPDALISLHINAAPWPVGPGGEVVHQLVDSNHSHVLIFGCLSDSELAQPMQKEQLILKLTNQSAEIERELGEAFAVAIGEHTALPASYYSGTNAVRLEGHSPYLWARNLLILRYVQCPVIMLEPHIANSKATYPRIQEALRNRQSDAPLPADDILLEYVEAVVAALLKVYGRDGKD